MRYISVFFTTFALHYFRSKNVLFILKKCTFRFADYTIKYFSQLLIFEKQKEKYAITQKKVGVLSAIPIFLYEYYGIEKTKTIIL